MKKHPKILYFFNIPVENEIKMILQGELPTDRLYGFIELRKSGWNVDYCDERISNFTYKIRRYINWINIKTILKASNYDVWLVKGELSLILTILAFCMKKKIVYIDSLFQVPKNRLRLLILYINVILAPRIILFSQYQANFWATTFKININKFIATPYTIDIEFYKKGICSAIADNTTNKPYVLAAGRDLGRDFATLIAATEKANVDLKLVTLPYLLPKSKLNNNIEVFERISYTELFQLYRNASVIVIPIKKNIYYPSGIRAVLEGMATGIPVICSNTPILSEHIPKESLTVTYFECEDSDSLARHISELIDNTKLQQIQSANASSFVERYFSMDVFVNTLANAISEDT